MRLSHAYRTKQGDAISAYLAFCGDTPVTATDIRNHFLAIQYPIGLATIYRHLERMVAEGLAKKIIPGDASGIRYQSLKAEAAGLFYLKCEDCGELTPLKCPMLTDIQQHIRADHGFLCDPDKSILYGTCRDCQAK